MFRPNYTKTGSGTTRDDDMRPESSPERVWALVRWVARHDSISRSALELQLTMETAVGKSNPEVGRVLRVAEELGLVQVDTDATVKLVVDPGVVTSPTAFRRYIQDKALHQKDSLFYHTTVRYLQTAEEISRQTSLQDVRAILDNDGDLGLTEHDIRGWRFWVSYLGLGYLQLTFLLPSAYVRIKDAVQGQRGLQGRGRLTAAQFVEWLHEECPEQVDASPGGPQFGLSLSNGLRMMEARRECVFERMPDAPRWGLYHFESEPVNDISHITFVAGGQK